MESLGLEFWIKAAAASFSLWSVVLGIVGWFIKHIVLDAVSESKKAREVFTEYVLAMERRMTTVEVQVKYLKEENKLFTGNSKQ